MSNIKNHFSNLLLTFLSSFSFFDSWYLCHRNRINCHRSLYSQKAQVSIKVGTLIKRDKKECIDYSRRISVVRYSIHFSNFREKKNQDVNFDKKVQPDSRKSTQSVHSIGHVYESIPLEHFSTDVILEDDGNENQDENKMYADISDHVYDRTFKHRPYLNQQPNLYHVISELKLKRL